ncbi:MAG: cytochrome c nitrite reductase small subunit [Desulfobacteraceae bacterium]|nr:cytochrome c nitrite reductase small subunit [Desulfobacteraceae bacterium]
MARVLTAVLIGVFLGVGIYTFQYAEGFSYASSDPRVCVNCHIMRPQFDSWQKSSHHKAATCVECHLPHDLIGKYVAKADNGRRHSAAFTFQDFHEPITITQKDSRILMDNCVRCHEGVLQGLVMMQGNKANGANCTHCHAGVGHGERAGLGRMEP